MWLGRKCGLEKKSESGDDLTTSNLVSHVCVPRSIGYIHGTDCCKGRDGLGIQEWPDGSRYEGEFENGLKHGVGFYSWPNGESYEGYFYKDYRHGKGTYTWPDGSKFTGKFYLNRKEGYGVQIFPDGSLFKGLYHADERFGPGVLSYADGRQDVGLWHRSRLLSLCTRLKDAFSLRSLPDFQPQSELQQGSNLKGSPQTVHPGPPISPAINKDPLVFSTEEILKDERFIMPPDTLRYAADPDHLPRPPCLRRQLDELFFCGRVPEASEDTLAHTHTHRHTSNLPLQERMQDHINRHRCEAECVDWAVDAVLSLHREAFGPKGPLEQGSERLIEEAARGDAQAVYRILRHGRIHPDVGDAKGHTALIAATVCCHNEVIHMLLDSGANVNKLNREGMSALAVCHVLYYPASSLHTTVAELRPKPHVPVPKAEEQRHEAGKDSTIYESPDQSHSANEEEAAQDHTQTASEGEEFMTMCVNEEGCLTKGVNEETCLTKDVNANPNLKAVNDLSEYSDNERLENLQREEPKQEASHSDGPQKEEPKQEASHTEGHQGEECKQEAFQTEEFQKEGPANRDFKGVELVIETSKRDGLMSEESGREGLVDEMSEKEGPSNDELKREIIVELSVPEELINEVTETGRTQTVTSTTSDLWEEPAAQRSQLEGEAVGGHMALDLEDSKRCLTADSALSLASFQPGMSEEAPCHSGLPPPEGAPEMLHKIGLTTQRSERWATLRLLLSRGADPNASQVPMPVLFLAIKAAHTQAIQLLLESGARTDICLSSELNGLYPLHVAAGLLGDEGPRITELLLHAVADPDVQAQDSHMLFELDKNTPDPHAGFANKSGNSSGVPCLGPRPPTDGGRTPLHIACQRDHDYKNARDVVCVLLSHKASTSLLWSGHSPLSLAIASGNDLAVDVLLAWGADPNLPLSYRVGSALCANANIAYDCVTQPRNRMLLLEKLLKADADILMPILVGEGRRGVMGTAVDYAYYSFSQDWRIAHTPYHALNPRERETLNARRQLLSIMGELLRKTATKTQQAALEDRSLGSCDVSPSEAVLYTKAQAATENTSTESIRKHVFKYCYQCGRSVGVVLVPCSRCHEVLYCSKTCKMKAWNDRHKEECVRVQGPEHSEATDLQERVPQREHTASCKRKMAKCRETAVKMSSQPSLLTQMKAHFRQKRIVEKLNKQQKVLAQKWAEKHHASGDQPKAQRAGGQKQSKASKKPPQALLYDPKENYSYN